MICAEAAEFVSALCDGETIPAEAAEHIAACAGCRSRLHDYLAMGVELRRAASVEVAAVIPARSWPRSRPAMRALWQKGVASMRIPRLAFAAIIAVLIALASTLAVVRVGAHATGSVVLLTINGSGNGPGECALSTVDKNQGGCAFIGSEGDYVLGYQIEVLSRDENRVQLGLRMRSWPKVLGGSASYSISDFATAPQRQFWFAPGDTLKVDVPNLPPLTITGNWLDHMPAFAGANNLDPGPNELRVVSPMLVQGERVLGDMEGGSLIQSKNDQGAWIYYPGHGGYLISPVPLQDGIEADVRLSRIAFKEDGVDYKILTGTPVTRAQHVWVLHQRDFEPGDDHYKYGYIGGRALKEVAPGKWAPIPMPD